MKRESTSELDSWNPMAEDYEDSEFNSYAGRNYERLTGFDMQQSSDVSSSKEAFVLHVKRIPLDITESGLRNLFNKYSDVDSVKLIRMQGKPNLTHQFGKVYFRSSQEAIKGLQAMNNKPPLFLTVEADRRSFPLVSKHLNQLPPTHIRSQAHLPVPSQLRQMLTESASRMGYGYQSQLQNMNGRAAQEQPRNKSLNEVKEALCVKCRSKATKCCTRCKTAYCSQACQKNDWDVHRYVCLSLKDHATERSHILATPPMPKQPPIPVCRNENPSKQSPQKPESGSETDIQPQLHLDLKTVQSQPRKAYDIPSSQQQSRPNSRNRNEQTSPNSGNLSKWPRPNSRNRSEPPRPNSGNRSEQPPPNSGNRSEQPRPNSGNRSEQPRPNSINRSEQPRSNFGENNRPFSGHAKHGQQPSWEGKSKSGQNPGNGNNQRPAAGGYKNPKEAPAANSGKQNNRQLSGEDCSDKVAGTGSGDGKNLQNGLQQGGYQPLRRPMPPQASAPKASRPTVPHKLHKKLPVTLGSSTKVRITHVNDPHNFYVQLEKDEDLADIMRKVQVVDCHAPPKEVAVGQIVAAKFKEDGVWYRGRVKKAEKGKIVVNFIDYGNDDSVAIHDLRCLNSEIMEFPVRAVWCRLANVHPTNGRWAPDAISFFNVINETIELHASLEKTCGGQAWIRLKEDPDKDTGEYMIEGSLATKNLPVHSSCLTDWQVGSEIQLATLTLEKVGKIWAMSITGIPNDQVVILFSELGKACASVETNVDSKKFDVGTVVAAKSPSDDAWYRGIILKVSASGYLVRYLDYGNCEVVDNLCLLPDAFCQIPTIGICFRIEEPYSIECIPDEFLADDTLNVKVLQVMGDTASVEVQFGSGGPSVQATASSIWKSSEGFEIPMDYEDVEPQAAKACHTATPPKSAEKNHSAVPSLAKSNEVKKPSLSYIINKSLPKIKVPSDTIAVSPVFVESLDRIWVQFLEEEKAVLLLKLTEELQLACQDEVLATLTNLPAVGQLVCGQFSMDGMWNRCLVEDVSADGEIMVRFIDYGNLEVTTLRSLKPLPNSFYDICPLALTVSIKPVTTLTLDSFQEAITPKQAEPVPLLMTVTDKSADPVRVVLMTVDGKSLGDFLSGFVDSAAAKEASGKDVQVLEVKSHSAVLEDHQPRISRGLEKVPADIQAVDATEAEDIQEELMEIPPFVQLEVGKCLDLGLGDVHSPDSIMVFKCDPDEAIVYDKLAEDITEYCAGASATQTQDLKMGDFCLAKSNAYGQWFRALVTDLMEGNKYQVLFVDYGNYEVVELSDTRETIDAFQKTPLQSVQCSIFGVKPREDGYSPKELEAFKELLNGQEVISAEIVQKDEDDCYTIRVPSIESELRKLGFLTE